jgi:hypothetical protein
MGERAHQKEGAQGKKCFLSKLRFHNRNFYKPKVSALIRPKLKWGFYSSSGI